MLDFSDLARSGTAPARYKPKSASKHSSSLFYGHDAGFGGGVRPASRAGNDISDINISLRFDRLTMGSGMSRDRGCVSTGDLPSYHGRITATRDGGRRDDALGDRVRDYIKRKPANLSSPLKRPHGNGEELGIPLSGRSDRRQSEDNQNILSFAAPTPFGNDEPTLSGARDRTSAKSSKVRAASAARYQPTATNAETNTKSRVKSAQLAKKTAIAQTYLKAPTPSPSYIKPRRASSSSTKPSSAHSRGKAQPVVANADPANMQDRKAERPLSKHRSFNEFTFKEGAASARPPSRQKHAFPTHLADLDFRPQKAFETQSDCSQSNSLRDNARMASSIKRPPSRHKPTGNGSVSYDGQRSMKHDSSRASIWQPANNDPAVDGFADIAPEHPCPFVIQITNSTDERAGRRPSTQSPSLDSMSSLSPSHPGGQMARRTTATTEPIEAGASDNGGSLGEALRRRRNEKPCSLQPAVKTINFDYHPAEASFRMRKSEGGAGNRFRNDARLVASSYDDDTHGEIAEDVNSDNDECSVLTDITNPTDQRSETQQSLALESTLGEDFLSLFADGSEYYMFENQNHNPWKQV